MPVIRYIFRRPDQQKYIKVFSNRFRENKNDSEPKTTQYNPFWVQEFFSEMKKSLKKPFFTSFRKQIKGLQIANSDPFCEVPNL